MERDAAGFYHDPPLWIERSPVSYTSADIPDFAAFSDEVFRGVVGDSIELRVTREGLFAFDFSNWSPGRYPPEDTAATFALQAAAVLNRTLVMNAFLAFFYTHELASDRYSRDRMVVTPELIITMDAIDSIGMGFGSQRVSRLAQSRFSSTYIPGVPALMDERLSFRSKVVALSVVEAAATDLRSLLDTRGLDGVSAVDLFLRASKAYQDHNYSSALITNWALIEQLIQEHWRQYIADNTDRDGRSFISGERRDRLTDGRTFTAAVIIEVLSLAEYIDYALFKDINKVRKARNDWMHSQKQVTSAQAVTSTDVCEKLLLLVRGITLTGQRGLRLHG